jgi:thioredoxin reductase (NADPH)
MRDGYDVVVAGGGLAGLTAGLTAARLGPSVLVLAGALPGGLLLTIDRIDGFPGYPAGVAGYELCPSVQSQAEAAGAEVVGAELERLGPVNGGWTVATDEGRVHATAVILATGARFRALGVPGEERLQGCGISTCASCDGPLLRGKTAAVVGGGDSALQEALALAEAGVRVVLLHRGDELDGQQSYRRRVAEHPEIEIRHRTAVEEILGDETVRALGVRDLETESVAELELAAVFLFVGLRPNSDRFGEYVALDAEGAVLTDGALRTTAAGVFAAGVVRSGAAGRASASSGDGATTAIAAHAYLADGVWPGTPATVGSI